MNPTRSVIFSLLVMAISLCSASAQVTNLVTWDMQGITTNDPQVAVSSVTAGISATPITLVTNDVDPTRGVDLGDGTFMFDNWTDNDTDTSTPPVDYFTFSVTNETGADIFLATLVYQTDLQSASVDVDAAYELHVSSDAFATVDYLLFNPSRADGGGEQTIDLSSSPVATWAEGQVLTFQWFATGGSNVERHAGWKGIDPVLTGEIDPGNPAIDTLVPADDALVALPASLTVTFNEEIAKHTTGSVTITNLTAGGADTIPIGSSELVVSGTNLVITPTTPALSGNTDYAVLIDGSAIKDLEGNFFAGITNTTEWSFTTLPTGNFYWAGPAIHEPFDMTAGEGLNGQEGGLGLDSWVRIAGLDDGTEGAGIALNSLTYATLPAGGNRLYSPGRYSNTFGDALTAGGLLDHGETLWFSVLIQPIRSSNTRYFLGLASDDSPDPTSNAIEAGTYAVGIHLDNGSDLRILMCPGDGDYPGSRTSIKNNISLTEPTFVVFEIIWAENGLTNDVVNAYLPGADLVLPASPSTTATAVIDQSTLDVLLVGVGSPYASAASMTDEIRYGASYDDVIINPYPVVIPPEGTLIIIQ